MHKSRARKTYVIKFPRIVWHTDAFSNVVYCNPPLHVLKKLLLWYLNTAGQIKKARLKSFVRGKTLSAQLNHQNVASTQEMFRLIPTSTKVGTKHQMLDIVVSNDQNT